MKTPSERDDERRATLLKRVRADIESTTPEEDVAVTAAAESDFDNPPKAVLKRKPVGLWPATAKHSP